eukprot:Skav209742  [mRNA]  locus=scaffold2057:30018:31353:- [translate_table: standard]
MAEAKALQVDTVVRQKLLPLSRLTQESGVFQWRLCHDAAESRERIFKAGPAPVPGRRVASVGPGVVGTGL